jgi:hypothetical protein
MHNDGTHKHTTHDNHQHEHEHDHQHSHQGHDMNINSMAVSATLHCITGCAIGEITGLIIGTILGLSSGTSIALAVALSFLFGYSLSILPLLKNGLSFKKALPIILAADTLSILVMEIVDNSVMAVVPGAMGAGLVNPLYWLTMAAALVAAFFVAVPVNKYLLVRGKGHALVHEYHH